MMEEKPIRLVVSGCCGRMGSLIVEEAAKDPRRFQLVGGLEHEEHPQLGKPLNGFPAVRVTSHLAQALQNADLLIEFTNPEATLAHAEVAAQRKVPLLIGTTGLSEEQRGKLKNLSKKIPIFWSANMSIGIVITRRLLERIYELLRPLGLDRITQVGISETHHTKKRDSPSGTAKQLAADIRRVSGQPFRDDQIEAKREGDVVGIHSVRFEFGTERVTLQHEALERRVFAQGALLVARNFLKLWKKPGWYNMDDFFSAMRKEKLLQPVVKYLRSSE